MLASTPRPVPATAGPGLVSAWRGLVLDASYAARPERFVRKPPEPPALPAVAWAKEPKGDPADTVFL